MTMHTEGPWSAAAMTPIETANFLRQFNEWRRGEGEGEGEDLQMPNPREIGKAIDAAVEMLDRMEKMQAALQIALRQNSHDMLMTAEELRWCEAILEETK